MENTRQRRRRKTEKPKIENYYKILGTRANAKPETIKRKYIEQVKAFPPETHPEEFQRIRRAYETLRDPAKRNEYDLMRKYGDKLDHLLEEAYEMFEQDEWESAEALYRQVLKIAPDNAQAHLGLAHLFLLQDEIEKFSQQYQAVVDLASSDADKVMLLASKAMLLLEAEEAEKALSVLDDTRGLYPDYVDRLRYAYIHVYRDSGREKEAWDLMQQLIPKPEEAQPEDISLYIDWINLMFDLEDWSLWSKIQPRVRLFLKSIQDEDDKFMVVTALMHEHSLHYRGALFREAQIFVDLAYFVDSKDLMIREKRRETQEFARIQKEIERTFQDRDMFPLVSLRAFEWFYEEFLGLEGVHMMENGLPPGMLDEMEKMNEPIAAGILRLKKKFPLVYRYFQERWDALYAENVAGLNRETRRRLR